MSRHLANCPFDNGQLNFIGISRHPSNEFDEVGERIIDRYHWEQCSTCQKYVKQDFNGRMILITAEEPNRNWFKVPRDD